MYIIKEDSDSLSIMLCLLVTLHMCMLVFCLSDLYVLQAHAYTHNFDRVWNNTFLLPFILNEQKNYKAEKKCINSLIAIKLSL